MHTHVSSRSISRGRGHIRPYINKRVAELVVHKVFRNLWQGPVGKGKAELVTDRFGDHLDQAVDNSLFIKLGEVHDSCGGLAEGEGSFKVQEEIHQLLVLFRVHTKELSNSILSSNNF